MADDRRDRSQSGLRRLKVVYPSGRGTSEPRALVPRPISDIEPPEAETIWCDASEIEALVPLSAEAELVRDDGGDRVVVAGADADLATLLSGRGPDVLLTGGVESACMLAAELMPRAVVTGFNLGGLTAIDLIAALASCDIRVPTLVVLRDDEREHVPACTIAGATVLAREDPWALVREVAEHTTAQWASGLRTPMRGRVGVKVGERIWDVDASDMRETGVAIAADIPLAPGHTTGLEIPVGRQRLSVIGRLIRRWKHEGTERSAFTFLGATEPEQALLRDALRRLLAVRGDALRAAYRDELTGIFKPMSEPG